MKKILFMIVIMAALFLVAGCESEANVQDDFAKCITESGATMYGAFSCGHCQTQKDMFGESVEHIDYVECDPRAPGGQPELCLEKNIRAYPTWIMGDGERAVGVQSFDALAAATGCELPQQN